MHLSIRDSVSTDAVIATIKCKELEFKLESKSSGSGEILFSKGKSNHFKRNKFTKGQRFHKQKLVIKCYHCQRVISKETGQRGKKRDFKDFNKSKGTWKGRFLYWR